ncbi:putative GMC-type oxidoreductase [Streptomyces sp. RB5]|uniref:Putative GMC-type oxidoreductase n=1 Tax=Streptomyces smaragdinus TaxID=2585196 RepID=A0A7K0CBL4_9ACTN|nr:GMC family oxidoreductase N-terminal domain-containing protein [Streptomyces smaragdinus]MQY10164.1 putative GMC-type oxidoreductase [Streptomyces smaragdinus]
MYDYVIVGAGSAGCVLAERLSADGRTRVALLEAGGPDDRREMHIPAAFPKLFKTDADWDFDTVAQSALAGRRLYWPRGRVLGGSSTLNAMMWVRGHRQGYDAWLKAGCPGWGYDDVLPYFHRIENRIGANPAAGPGARVYGEGGPLYVEDLRSPNVTTAAFLDACEHTGLPRLPDANVADNEGCAQTTVSQHRGRRWSAADAWLKPALRRPNLDVRTGAHATRLLFDGRRATGVEYRDEHGETRSVTVRGEILLAAGAVGSPHLLLRSGIGDPGHLAEHGVDVVADAPEVGRNLQDHLSVGVSRHCPRPVTLVGADADVRQLARYFLARRGPLTSTVAEAVAFWRSDPALPAPDVEFVYGPAPFIDHGLEPPAGHGITIGAVLLSPASRGTVRLASADPLAPPDIDPGYLTDPADLAVLAAGVRRAQQLYTAPSLAPYAGDPIEPAAVELTDDELTAFVREQAETLYHPVGTCRMGDDSGAVVDPALRVRGVTGLRVADASVMPLIPHGHTNAPTMMIAERAAELIPQG